MDPNPNVSDCEDLEQPTHGEVKDEHTSDANCSDQDKISPEGVPYVPQHLLDLLLEPQAPIDVNAMDDDAELRPMRVIDSLDPQDFERMFRPYLYFGGRNGRSLPGRVIPRNIQPFVPVSVPEKSGDIKPEVKNTQDECVTVPQKRKIGDADSAIKLETGTIGKKLRRLHLQDNEKDLIMMAKLDKQLNDAVQRTRQIRRKKMLLIRKMKQNRKVTQLPTCSPCP